MGTYDVVCVGSSTVDVFADTESELIKIKTVHSEEELIAYPSGSKILIKELRFTTGGGGTNTSVSMARLGLNAAYLGKVGNDNNGRRILELLEKEKVDFVGVRGKEMSGYSIILDSLEHDRTILTYKGTNDTLRFNELKSRLKDIRTKWFYFSSMTGKSYEVLEKLAEYAKKNSIKVAFNPSSYLAEKGSRFLKKVLDNTDLLVLNMEEAHLLTGNCDEKETAKRLHVLGPKMVVVTDRTKPVYAYDGKNMHVMKPHGVKVIESTGAGDAFASSFLAGLIRKNDIRFALQLALANAESVLCYHGAKNKLLTWNEALKIIKRNPGVVKRV